MIFNSYQERSHKLRLNAYATYRIHPTFDMTLRLLNTVYFYKVNYVGTYDNLSRQTYGSDQVMVVANWKPSNKVNISLAPSVNITHRNIRDVSARCETNPNFYLSFNWYQSDKAFMNVWGQYYTWQPYASTVNEVIQQDTELEWSMGNPALKNCQMLVAGAGQSWMCTPWFTPSLNIQYSHGNNMVYKNFIAAPQDKGGVILQYADCGVENTFNCNLSINFNLFNRKLNLNLNPGWEMVNDPGDLRPFTSHRFQFKGYAQYNIRNFSIVAFYSIANRRYYNHGQYYFFQPDYLNLELKYGNGNFYASFSVNNVLHKYYNNGADYAFPNLISRSELHNTGRQFVLNLSYTFGYGKRINSEINIDNTIEFQSGVYK